MKGKGIKRKVRVYVDKIYRTGQYRVQTVEIIKYPSGETAENFMGKRTFNMRKDAEEFAKKQRKKFK